MPIKDKTRRLAYQRLWYSKNSATVIGRVAAYKQLVLPRKYKFVPCVKCSRKTRTSISTIATVLCSECDYNLRVEKSEYREKLKCVFFYKWLSDNWPEEVSAFCRYWTFKTSIPRNWMYFRMWEDDLKQRVSLAKQLELAKQTEEENRLSFVKKMRVTRSRSTQFFQSIAMASTTQTSKAL